MTSKDKRSADAAHSTRSDRHLRERAEEIVRENAISSQEGQEPLSPQETRQTLHELRVHQIELEMQTEELRRTQMELESARARYFDLYDLAPVGYCTISEKGQIKEVNLTAANLLDVTRSALVRQPFTAFIQKEDRDIYYMHSKPLFETGAPQVYELRMVKKDAAPFWARLEATREQDADGTMLCRVTVSDITERKHAEQALVKKSEDLARSNADLAQFAYVASHDLQEPLRTITRFVQLLDERYQGKLDRDADEFIGFIVGGTKRMQQIINDLLAYSRVNTRREPPHIVKIDNAMKFHGEEAPRVEISAVRKGDDWIFSVRDNGIGIDPQYKDRIFEIFQRLHTCEEYPGTGIGLAIAKKIVERHQGHIWVDSQPGKGSTFNFTLPVDAKNA